MLCEKCKERPASVVITKSFMGESVEQQLCEKCAFQSESSHFDPHQEPLSIQQFLSHWFGEADLFQANPKRQGTRVNELECSACQLTYAKFLDIGKFGCSSCYDAFRDRLPHVFGKLHSSHAAHTGKIPVSFNEIYAVKRKIEEVRGKMQEAVAAERFEEAAALRDEAKALQDYLAHGGDKSDVD